MPKTTVFIAGSRAISRLNDTIRKRIDNIVLEGHDVVVGDANGADRMVQQYLADKGYQRVVVYCTGARCRNNVGAWPTVAVAPPAGVHGGFEFYAAKDQQMAEAATHGLMLWDGESRGTLANVKNLLAAKKPSVVYLSPLKKFLTVRSTDDLGNLLETVGPFALEGVKRRA